MNVPSSKVSLPYYNQENRIICSSEFTPGDVSGKGRAFSVSESLSPRHPKMNFAVPMFFTCTSHCILSHVLGILTRSWEGRASRMFIFNDLSHEGIGCTSSRLAFTDSRFDTNRSSVVITYNFNNFPHDVDLFTCHLHLDLLPAEAEMPTLGNVSGFVRYGTERTITAKLSCSIFLDKPVEVEGTVDVLYKRLVNQDDPWTCRVEGNLTLPVPLGRVIGAATANA